MLKYTGKILLCGKVEKYLCPNIQGKHAPTRPVGFLNMKSKTGI